MYNDVAVFFQILLMFEHTLTDLLSAFLAQAKTLFGKARVVDTRYFRRLSELGEGLEDAPFSEDTASAAAAGAPRETVVTLMTQCHDSHQGCGRRKEVKLSTGFYS